MTLPASQLLPDARSPRELGGDGAEAAVDPIRVTGVHALWSGDERRLLSVLAGSAVLHTLLLIGVYAMPAPVEAPAPVRSLHVEERLTPIVYFDAEPEEEEPVEEPDVEPAEPEEAPEPELAEAPEDPAPDDVLPEPELDEEPVLAEAPAPPQVDVPEPEPEEPAPAAVEVAAAPVEAVTPVDAGDGPEMPSTGAPSSGALAAAPPSEGTPGGAGPVDSAGTAPADDADLGRMRSRFRRQLERRLAPLQNAYSPSLRRDAVEGIVVVEILIDDRGRIVNVELVSSSGDDRLDAYAVAEVRRLRRLVAPPPELGDSARVVELPISYAIRS